MIGPLFGEVRHTTVIFPRPRIRASPYVFLIPTLLFPFLSRSSSLANKLGQKVDLLLVEALFIPTPFFPLCLKSFLLPNLPPVESPTDDCFFWRASLTP